MPNCYMANLYLKSETLCFLNLSFLARDATQSAILTWHIVCPSVSLSLCPSVRHIGWNSWKTISQLLAYPFFSLQIPTSRIYNLNFSRNRSGVWKNWLRAYTAGNICKWLKTERRLLLTAYIKSYTGFRLPTRCIILNDL